MFILKFGIVNGLAPLVIILLVFIMEKFKILHNQNGYSDSIILISLLMFLMGLGLTAAYIIDTKKANLKIILGFNFSLFILCLFLLFLYFNKYHSINYDYSS